MTEFKWQIEWMKSKPTVDGLNNVVVSAGWRCTGVQDEHSSTVYGSCNFSDPNPENFVQYDNLTEQQVLEWCWSVGVDKASAEEAIQTQINEKITPPVVMNPLPWNSLA